MSRSALTGRAQAQLTTEGGRVLNFRSDRARSRAGNVWMDQSVVKLNNSRLGGEMRMRGDHIDSSRVRAHAQMRTELRSVGDQSTAYRKMQELISTDHVDKVMAARRRAWSRDGDDGDKVKVTEKKPARRPRPGTASSKVSFSQVTVDSDSDLDTGDLEVIVEDAPVAPRPHTAQGVSRARQLWSRVRSAHARVDTGLRRPSTALDVNMPGVLPLRSVRELRELTHIDNLTAVQRQSQRTNIRELRQRFEREEADRLQKRIKAFIEDVETFKRRTSTKATAITLMKLF